MICGATETTLRATAIYIIIIQFGIWVVNRIMRMQQAKCTLRILPLESLRLSAAHGVIERVAHIDARFWRKFIEVAEHRFKMAFQNAFCVIIIQFTAEIVDDDVEIAQVSGHPDFSTSPFFERREMIFVKLLRVMPRR